MNPVQRIVLGIGAAIIAVMVLFPPWLITYDPPSEFLFVQKATRPAGYHVILSPPVAEDRAELARMFGLPNDEKDEQSVLLLNYFSMVIDKDRLMVQLAGALAVTVLLAFLFKSKK